MKRVAIQNRLPGKPYPLGATWSKEGTNFSIYSESASAVELCLFDSRDPSNEMEIIPIQDITGHVWHTFLPEVKAGQLYGYRIHGPFQPEIGQRFNPQKLLLDPYAKAIAGKVNWKAPVFAYQPGSAEEDLSENNEDDAWGMPRGVVINPEFHWMGDKSPHIPWNKSVIYELHVKGFTALHTGLPPWMRGTYAGLASRPVIKYLKQSGITAVELMPVQDFLDDKLLVERGLRNYWGYNTTNFFSPSAIYSSTGDRGQQVNEFKKMVRAMHRAGIEVIIDVVYNHTSEGNHLGPTLSFRGIDNRTYYRLKEGQERYYIDYTGTGNSLNVRHPQVLKLIMDSLRYWVLDMHVDGFRFDLASTLARELHDVDRLAAFFDIIHQDPVLSVVKLIAEPWDVGPGGYQVGGFPVLWTEWNGKYRDCIRKYWKGDDGQVAELASRLTGSSDLYQHDGRKPYASINFVSCHDGFTLNDLVSYNQKHNEANGEKNRDGSDQNHSWNCGVEGPTNRAEILELRERQKRNILSTLIFSQGVPMIYGGDEIGRTQEGNNNAYCQDSPLTWQKWLEDDKQALFNLIKNTIQFNIRPGKEQTGGQYWRNLIRIHREPGSMFRLYCLWRRWLKIDRDISDEQKMQLFTRRILQIYKNHPVFHRRNFFQGRTIRPSEAIKDIAWLRQDGQEMTDADWNSSWLKCIAVMYAGEDRNEVDEKGQTLEDDLILMILNSDPQEVQFVLPPVNEGSSWEVLVDTGHPVYAKTHHKRYAEKQLTVEGRVFLLLKSQRQKIGGNARL